MVLVGTRTWRVGMKKHVLYYAQQDEELEQRKLEAMTVAEAKIVMLILVVMVAVVVWIGLAV